MTRRSSIAFALTSFIGTSFIGACHMVSGVDDYDKVETPTTQAPPASVPVGEPCIAHGECETGACHDGLCCDAPCAGPCLACNLAGSEGTCVAHSWGENPENGCAAVERCNGAGACVLLDGFACNADEQCLNGHCPNDDQLCCESACDEPCVTCANATGECLPVEAGGDDAKCALGTCFQDAACCGDVAPPSLGQACPAESPCEPDCSDGVCRIAADVQDEFKGLVIECPPGLDCEVECTAKSACELAQIVCPPGRRCDVVCGIDNDKCKGAEIACDASGPCHLSCKGGNGCGGTTMTCGANACQATCTDLSNNNDPSIVCGDSCGCDYATCL